MLRSTLLTVLSLAACAVSAPAQDLILINARIVDVRTGAISEASTVLVEGGKIKQITTGRVIAPDGTRTVDLMGRFLAPGMMDAHVHVGSAADAGRALSAGVTTMRSMGTAH